MSGKASTAVAAQQIRQSHLELTIPSAYEFTCQMVGDEDIAAALVSDVLVSGHDTNGPVALDFIQLWVLNKLYRRSARIESSVAPPSDSPNLLSVLLPERRAAVVVHDVMGLDKSASAMTLGVSKERFTEILHDARVALRDYLSGLGLV